MTPSTPPHPGSAAPDFAAWDDLLAALGRIPAGAARRDAVARAADALAGWPPALRCVLPAWMAALCAGTFEPDERAGLVRCLTVAPPVALPAGCDLATLAGALAPLPAIDGVCLVNVALDAAGPPPAWPARIRHAAVAAVRDALRPSDLVGLGLADARLATLDIGFTTPDAAAWAAWLADATRATTLHVDADAPLAGPRCRVGPGPLRQASTPTPLRPFRGRYELTGDPEARFATDGERFTLSTADAACSCGVMGCNYFVGAGRVVPLLGGLAVLRYEQAHAPFGFRLDDGRHAARGRPGVAPEAWEDAHGLAWFRRDASAAPAVRLRHDAWQVRLGDAVLSRAGDLAPDELLHL